MNLDTPPGASPNQTGDVFVIRMSSDNRPFLPARWRATVLYVRTGERRLVSSYDDLCSFIEEARRSNRRSSAG